MKKIYFVLVLEILVLGLLFSNIVFAGVEIVKR